MNLEPIMDGVVRVVGHPFTVPAGLAIIAVLALVVGIDMTNLTISIVTFALLPILQHSQNRDGLAIQAKLDAIIKGVDEADNRLVAVDQKTETEIRELRDNCDE